MTEFMKQIKKANADLTDEEAAQIAASKIADSKPKSRMYYKIGASREMAGGKKVDPKANMSDKLKVMFKFMIFTPLTMWGQKTNLLFFHHPIFINFNIYEI